MMWGWWGRSDRPELRLVVTGLVVALIIGILISGRASIGNFWWFIFIFPVFFGGASRRWRRRYADWSDEELEAELEKRKNDRFYTEDDYEKEKNVEYRLGADGELVPIDNSLEALTHDMDEKFDREDDEENTFLVPRERRSGEDDRTQYV